MSARQCLLGRMLANARPCVAHTPVTRRPPQCWRHTASARQPNPVATAATTRRHTLGGLLGGVLLLDAASMRGGRSVASAAAVSDVEKVLEEPKWPEQWPFRDTDFLRYDESVDTIFYDQPRFVYHIDEYAVKALTGFYGKVFPAAGNKDVAVLDICSSWVSHYPPGYTAGKVTGLGMNKDELARNEQLTDYVVHDLNADPTLPFPDNSYDVITNCVSVDYLNKPLQVFKEIHRVLKPGGVAYMSFSNRCFPTKAIALWTATGDLDHVWIVGSYFHYSVPGGFEAPQCKDISPKAGLFGRTDPMYVVYGRKAAAGGAAAAAADSSAAGEQTA